MKTKSKNTKFIIYLSIAFVLFAASAWIIYYYLKADLTIPDAPEKNEMNQKVIPNNTEEEKNPFLRTIQ